TDFYSLGVTFYELLAGQLPFATTDPMELVHCHLARSPMPLCEVGEVGKGEQGTGNRKKSEFGIRNTLREEQSSTEFGIPNSPPKILSDIVLKLMSKTAEDRYQSAFGLRYDLERCQQSWQSQGHIPDFVLGERDVCDRFTIPEKLYGREPEVQTLLDAFERVAGNRKQGTGDEFGIRNSEFGT
ncbi:MAG: hypothetical protein AAFW75_33655, partial [Cyanobacteria bacterium J06636_16]